MSSTDTAEAGIVLWTCYAMSGSDLACPGVCLRTRYEMPGTDVGRRWVLLKNVHLATGWLQQLEKKVSTYAYQPTRMLRMILYVCGTGLRLCYATSATDPQIKPHKKNLCTVLSSLV
eukprot:1028943-Rhodomonas_salina.1